jgi:hypothetical protein
MADVVKNPERAFSNQWEDSLNSELVLLHCNPDFLQKQLDLGMDMFKLFKDMFNLKDTDEQLKVIPVQEVDGVWEEV